VADHTAALRTPAATVIDARTSAKFESSDDIANLIVRLIRRKRSKSDAKRTASPFAIRARAAAVLTKGRP
jgi:hypothetical protein